MKMIKDTCVSYVLHKPKHEMGKTHLNPPSHNIRQQNAAVSYSVIKPFAVMVPVLG